MPNVCCTVEGNKKCKEYTYTPSGRAAAKRAAEACRQKGGRPRTSMAHHKETPPKPPTAVQGSTGVEY